MRLKIITIPKHNSELRQKSKDFNIADINKPEWQKFFDALGKKMISADGAGLASPQVAKKIRVFTVNIDNEKVEIFINPKLSKKSLLTDIAEEGCLSVPGIYGKVKRHKSIEVEYYNKLGEKKKERFFGFNARVIQHENDHLEGVLFIDKLVK